MTHLQKELWGDAMKEGKRMADHVIALNKSQQKFIRRKDDDMVTDREMALSAAMNVFWAYKVSQEASHAARIMTWQKIEDFIEGGTNEENFFQAKRLLKTVRRLKNQEAPNGFLRMWDYFEKFLQQGQSDEFWARFDKPSTAVAAIVKDLGFLASIGDDDNGEEQSSSNGSTQGQESPEGVLHQIEPGRDHGTRETEREAGDGTDGGGRSLQAGGRSLEASESGTQSVPEKDERPAEKAGSGSDDGNGDGDRGHDPEAKP